MMIPVPELLEFANDFGEIPRYIAASFVISKFFITDHPIKIIKILQRL